MESLIFILNKSHHIFMKRIDGKFKSEIGISLIQAMVLIYLDHNGRCLNREIACVFGWNQSAVTTLLRRMESNTLIMREKSDKDARKDFVLIHEAAKEKARMAHILLSKIEDEITDGLSVKKVNCIKSFLSNIC